MALASPGIGINFSQVSDEPTRNSFLEQCIVMLYLYLLGTKLGIITEFDLHSIFKTTSSVFSCLKSRSTKVKSKVYQQLNPN